MATWSADPLGPIPFSGTEEQLRAFQAACGRMGQRLEPPLVPKGKAPASAAPVNTVPSLIVAPRDRNPAENCAGSLVPWAEPPALGAVDRSQPGWEWRGRAKGLGDP